MAETTLSLAPEQQERFQAWLDDKMASEKCNVCGANAWKIGVIVNLPVEVPDQASTRKMSYKAAGIQCANCANILLFDAYAIGLV